MSAMKTFLLAIFLVAFVFFVVYISFSLSGVEKSSISSASTFEYKQEHVKFAINNDLFTLKELDSFDYKLAGKTYNVMLINVNTENNMFCQIIVDGEITNKLRAGDSETVSGLKIKIGDIYT